MVISDIVMTIGVGISQKKKMKNLTPVTILWFDPYVFFIPLKLCTVDLEIRELERSTINLVPEMVFMEGDTVLVQYIISRWSLQLR